MSENIEQYARQHGIRVEVIRDRGAQVNDEGWEHHAYILRLVGEDGRTMEDIPWMQGYAIETVPQDEPWGVLDALVSEAGMYEGTQSFETFCEEFGYDVDSRRAERIFNQLRETSERLAEFLGGRDELEHVMNDIERL